MTIPGVDAIAGISIVAAVGDFSRFQSADELAAHVGSNQRGVAVSPETRR